MTSHGAFNRKRVNLAKVRRVLQRQRKKAIRKIIPKTTTKNMTKKEKKELMKTEIPKPEQNQAQTMETK